MALLPVLLGFYYWHDLLSLGLMSCVQEPYRAYPWFKYNVPVPNKHFYFVSIALIRPSPCCWKEQISISSSPWTTWPSGSKPSLTSQQLPMLPPFFSFDISSPNMLALTSFCHKMDSTSHHRYLLYFIISLVLTQIFTPRCTLSLMDSLFKMCCC